MSLNIDNVPDARMFTGNSFHSRIIYLADLFVQTPPQFLWEVFSSLSRTAIIDSTLTYTHHRGNLLYTNFIKVETV